MTRQSRNTLKYRSPYPANTVTQTLIFLSALMDLHIDYTLTKFQRSSLFTTYFMSSQSRNTLSYRNPRYRNPNFILSHMSHVDYIYYRCAKF